LITSASAIAVLFILLFIAKDAIPFFFKGTEGVANDAWSIFVYRVKEFFGSTGWYPTNQEKHQFGSLAIFVGSAYVTFGAIVVAVPLGVSAAVCLSDVLPFGVRQAVKPVIEILAAIPSVAYGFFALVVLAPLLQDKGGSILSVAVWLVLVPLGGLAILVASDVGASSLPERSRKIGRIAIFGILSAGLLFLLILITRKLNGITISSGTNALNVSIILGIMAMPTVVSVAEDALQAVGRDLREGSYALGATRAETIVRVVLPAAASGIMAAVILGIMRAVGETMVVWMASGNASQIPHPWYNFLSPVRTLTATIAGDMGEASHMGSAHYHALFAMAFCLLIVSFVCNLASEWAVRRTRNRLAG
jgi:phosphate transport system permease protein